MKAVIQRVCSASVSIAGQTVGTVGKGFMVLLGITTTDTEKEAQYLCDKMLNLRIFEDEEGKMNRSLGDVGGALLIVSQFTLCANAKKGNRPSFTDAARPEQAIPLYEGFVEMARQKGFGVETGQFGADMLVSIQNDGPVTIILDTDEIMPKQ